MTKDDKIMAIEDGKVIGYWSCFGGVEVRKIEYTPDGAMFWVKANAWNGKPSYHVTKVVEQYTTDGTHGDHIRLFGKRLYLDDCIRA